MVTELSEFSEQVTMVNPSQSKDVNVVSIKMTFWDMVCFQFKWAFASLFVMIATIIITSPAWLVVLFILGVVG